MRQFSRDSLLPFGRGITHPGPTGHPSEEGIFSCSPLGRGGRRPGWVLPALAVLSTVCDLRPSTYANPLFYRQQDRDQGKALT